MLTYRRSWENLTLGHKKSMYSLFANRDSWFALIKDKKHYVSVEFTEEQIRTMKDACPWQGWDVNDVFAPERFYGYILFHREKINME